MCLLIFIKPTECSTSFGLLLICSVHCAFQTSVFWQGVPVNGAQRHSDAAATPLDAALSLGTALWGDNVRKAQSLKPLKNVVLTSDAKRGMSRTKVLLSDMHFRGFQVTGLMCSATACKERQHLINLITNLLHIKHKTNQIDLLCKPGIFCPCCWPAVTQLLPGEKNNHRCVSFHPAY